MVDSAYFVKSTSLRVFTGSFQHFADLFDTDILQIFSTQKTLRVFTGSFQHFADLFDTDILKMCTKKFDTEKYFLTILQDFC